MAVLEACILAHYSWYHPLLLHADVEGYQGIVLGQLVWRPSIDRVLCLSSGLGLHLIDICVSLGMSTPAVCLILTSTYFHATHSSVQQWQRLAATHVCSSSACMLPFVRTSTAAAAVEAPAACCNERPLQLIVHQLCILQQPHSCLVRTPFVDCFRCSVLDRPHSGAPNVAGCALLQCIMQQAVLQLESVSVNAISCLFTCCEMHLGAGSCVLANTTP